jgi:outer membrane protein TolC
MRKDISAMAAVVAVIILAQCPVVLGESNEPNQFLALGDYLLYAEAHNAGLKSSYEQFQAAIEQVPQAKSFENPTVSYGYATERTPQRSVFEVMQMFPWFGTIEARTDAATAAAKSARQQYEAKRLEVFYQVKDAFYDYSYLARAIEITKENLELVKHFEGVARARYATSATSHPDTIRAQIELAKLEDILRSFEKSRPAIVARLSSILNRPADSNLPWPKPPPYQRVSIGSEMLLALVRKSNPELKSFAYNIEAAASSEKLSRKRFYPDIGVGVSIDAGMGENGKSRIMPVVSLTLPVWRDNYTAGERQAQAQLRQATADKNQIENTLLERAQQVLYEFDDSNRKIQLYADTIIPKTKEMVTACESAYQSGTLDFLSLTDSQRSLLEYQLYYEQAVAENSKRLAELEMLAGRQFSKNSDTGEK